MKDALAIQIRLKRYFFNQFALDGMDLCKAINFLLPRKDGIIKLYELNSIRITRFHYIIFLFYQKRIFTRNTTNFQYLYYIKTAFSLKISL